MSRLIKDKDYKFGVFTFDNISKALIVISLIFPIGVEIIYSAFSNFMLFFSSI